jgi:hypothetical protein
VRALKYVPLVVFRVLSDEWFVVPAHRVVALVAWKGRKNSKGRGQHTENAFESSNITLTHIRPYAVAEADLRAAVIAAHGEAAKYPALAAIMRDILDASRRLARESREQVQAELLRVDLGPGTRPGAGS